MTKKNNQLVRPSTVLWSIPAFGFQLLLAKTHRIWVWRIENQKKHVSAKILDFWPDGHRNQQETEKMPLKWPFL